VASSPAVADGYVYVGSLDGNVYCLNAATGDLIWNYATDNLVGSSPAVAGGYVFVGSYDHRVYAFGVGPFVPEFPAFVVPLVIVAATLFATVICKQRGLRRSQEESQYC